MTQNHYFMFAPCRVEMFGHINAEDELIRFKTIHLAKCFNVSMLSDLSCCHVKFLFPCCWSMEQVFSPLCCVPYVYNVIMVLQCVYVNLYVLVHSTYILFCQSCGNPSPIGELGDGVSSHSCIWIFLKHS